jgi:hypothetical protein
MAFLPVGTFISVPKDRRTITLLVAEQGWHEFDAKGRDKVLINNTQNQD